MRNIKITIEYDGASFFGWQKQPGLRTVQGVIEESLQIILQEEIKITGAGRTDRGVHALGQAANFHTESKIGLNILLYKLNRFLPDDVKIKSIKEADGKFNARYNAKSKLYKYTILNSKIPRPLARLYSFYVPDNLDITKMRNASKFLIGRHDFTSFATSGSSVDNFVRTIDRIRIKKEKDFIYISIEAKSFLKNMVRNIAAVLIETGKNKMEPKQIKEILKFKDRGKVPKSAPPEGLCLIKIKY